MEKVAELVSVQGGQVVGGVVVGTIAATVSTGEDVCHGFDSFEGLNGLVAKGWDSAT